MQSTFTCGNLTIETLKKLLDGLTLTLTLQKQNDVTQQTFVLMKTSSRQLDQDKYVRLKRMSSEDIFRKYSERPCQDEYIRLGHTSSRRLQDVL